MDETPRTPPDPSTAASPPAATPPPAAWEGPSPDAVAWLLVSWHNRHPLARRISLQDVHTVGAVALPFLAQALPKEPGLAPPADDAPPTAAPAKRRWPWQRKAATGPRPLWAESFIPGLKPAAVAALALDHGFTAAPDELPLRRVDIANGDMAAGEPNQSGAWPMELVLLSAAIDAGPARTRVLVGRRDRVLGRRALDPVRLGAVAAVGVLLLALLTWLLWPSSGGHDAEAAADAASAASSASSATPRPAPATAPVVDAASSPTPVSSAPATSSEAAATSADAASAAIGAASVPAAPTAPASAAVIPSIRPTLGGEPDRGRPPLGAGVTGTTGSRASPGGAPSADTATGTPPGAAAASRPAAPATEAEQRLQVDDAGLADVMKRAAPGGKLVALVSLPQKTRPEAEAQLTRMRELIGQTLRAQVPNGEVFQTKEGWRAAVWPFGSREEAQLINATLLARGVRARAVDF